jgi:hypothetical protein
VRKTIFCSVLLGLCRSNFITLGHGRRRLGAQRRSRRHRHWRQRERRGPRTDAVGCWPRTSDV